MDDFNVNIENDMISLVSTNSASVAEGSIYDMDPQHGWELYEKYENDLSSFVSMDSQSEFHSKIYELTEKSKQSTDELMVLLF